MLLATVPLLALVAAAPWPPSSVSATDAARVERGEVVQQRALVGDEIRYTVTGRVDGPPDVVFATARDLCRAPVLESGAKARLLSPEVAERELARTGGELDRAAVEKLPALTCSDASARTTFYLFVVSPGRYFLPDMEMLLRQEVRPRGDGSYSLRTVQVAGGIGDNPKMETEVRLLPLPDGRTAWDLRGIFGVPSFLPDFLVQRMMETPDEDDPNLKRLEQLRARVRARTSRSTAPPATTLGASPDRR